ncbi:hypothetical protein E2562_025488 [Oryza meyeriana var. granulata]|uniref:Sm protein B n=1 Tax=Oryza meyeriana var. granulata TaxID=110450 RepID=A0A6G1CIF1_9ORYZ|nr:hypothetical protein E2562_025488 [Oryza meyeriana var. granulata]KAF0899926.1 hypothetical protein E2562_025488 [Oryza meyeriana var. granulata]KAF0899927.1 hypothetical protein E2562_025488 [Oryza meyeriana var. granulata]
MSNTKGSKMLQFVNYRMRVTIHDGSQLVDKFMALDHHMNLVLGECEEFHKLLPSKSSKTTGEGEERRTLGLLLLRGEEVVSMTVEGPPPPDESRAKAAGARIVLAGLGVGCAAGPGVPAGKMLKAQLGLAGTRHDAAADLTAAGIRKPSATTSVHEGSTVRSAAGEAWDACGATAGNEAKDAVAALQAWDATIAA